MLEVLDKTQYEIRVLNSDVIDQIAAGEVVERPSHLVKELVENSIDAGATEIEVELEQGGREVRVLDNGRGISERDLERALARHATSKIQSANDLWSVASFGFRGEALASISSVSKLTLVSKQEGQSSAFKVTSDFGKVSLVVPASGNLGSSVHVSELFENVPARLKFMKSEAAEGSQIRNVIRALALSHPEVSFRLRVNGKPDLHFNRLTFKEGESFIDRAQDVLGIKLFRAAGEYEGYRAEMAFSAPQDVMRNARGLWFFVQDRFVQDRTLQAAVLESYRNLLMHGEYPYAVVKVWAPPGDVDVNIHPTKSQVKFRDSSKAFRAVSRTLRDSLEKAPWVTSSAKGTAAQAASARTSAQATDDHPHSHFAVAEAVKKYSASDFSKPYQKFDSPELERFQYKTKADLLLREEERSPVTEQLRHAGSPSLNRAVWSRLNVIGQSHQTYIVCQDDTKLILVDQHAAHERVAFERLMRAWKAKELTQTIEIQTLLIPLLIDLDDDLTEELLKCVDDFQKIGISVEQIGPRTIAVHSLPVILKEKVLTKAFQDLAHSLRERGGSFVLEEKIGDIFATMACHSVVRAGQALSVTEMQELLRQMDEFPLSGFCPHGRPVSVEYPFSQIERDFGRLV